MHGPVQRVSGADKLASQDNCKPWPQPCERELSAPRLCRQRTGPVSVPAGEPLGTAAVRCSPLARGPSVARPTPGLGDTERIKAADGQDDHLSMQPLRWLPGRAQAGRGAHTRFRQLRSRWRRRVLGRLQLPLSLLRVLLYLLGPRTPTSWRWWTGTAFGALLSMWVWAWDTVPERIDRWRVGATGERRTERVLRPLAAAGWTIRHDLDDHPYGNIDHVVIGPPGVFVLDSKVWSGQVTIEGDVPVVTPPEDPAGAWSWPRLPVHLRAMATGVRRRTGVPVWVQPVVVLWAPFPAGVVEADGVVYVQGDRLASWLQGQPARWSQGRRPGTDQPGRARQGRCRRRGEQPATWV